MLHVGRGTDGGFGDYSPPYWSEDPVAVDGRVIWFGTRGEADDAAAELNEESQTLFYSVGEHDTYDGYFPVEYEVRKIVVPESKSAGVRLGVTLVADAHKVKWLEQY